MYVSVKNMLGCSKVTKAHVVTCGGFRRQSCRRGSAIRPFHILTYALNESRESTEEAYEGLSVCDDVYLVSTQSKIVPTELWNHNERAVLLLGRSMG